jgi:hypothetical protein
MRVSCPRCQKRFDIPHVAVLVESRRLADVAKAGKAVVAGTDGNRLDPADDTALEQRAEAIQRRKRQNSPP